MLERLREFLRSPAGKGVAVVVVLLCLVYAWTSVRSAVVSDAEELSSNRMFVDAATGKPFRAKLEVGMPFPLVAPSGGNTGYPAEACYWTKEGTAKAEPTYVLLNMYKGSNDPTFCPDCGRLVVGHNPPAAQAKQPPPTKEEYAKQNRK